MPDRPADDDPRTAGLLVLVVGPSGAGKDALIDGARAALAGRATVFARRVVTRPSSEAERHDSLDPERFRAAEADGAFAFHWRAHGLDYAIPIGIEASLRRGDTVVCNVSRGVVASLRSRYRRVRVIYVDAPLAVRLSRIAGRGRPSDRADRGRRDQDFTPDQADCLVVNDGPLDTALAAFVDALSAP